MSENRNTEHYYTKDPASAHNEMRHEETVMGKKIVFITDNGVFSKAGLDAGTRLLIEASMDCGGSVLDMGCGWGAVGITLLMCGVTDDVTFTDINERAADLCRHNLELNRLSGHSVHCGAGFEKVPGKFGHILLNPPIHAGKKVIYDLFREAKEHLLPGGTIRVVMMTHQGADSAKKELESIYGDCRIISRGSGYKVLLSVNGD